MQSGLFEASLTKEYHLSHKILRTSLSLVAAHAPTDETPTQVEVLVVYVPNYTQEFG
jgi:putative NIF3 family GTP cyclohydrolase 1 type 2